MSTCNYVTASRKVSYTATHVYVGCIEYIYIPMFQLNFASITQRFM